MSSRTYPVIGGRTLRITKEDRCGIPAWGDFAQLVSSGFVSVAATANYNDGNEKVITNARGDDCYRRPAEPRLIDLTLAIVFCGVDPDAYSAVTGFPRVVHPVTGETIGYDTDTDIRPFDVRFGLEVWSDAYDILECDNEEEIPYGYFLYPSVSGGRVGDYTLEDAGVTFSITDAHTFGGAGWEIGPYEVTVDESGDPSRLLDALTRSKHVRQFVTTIAPPEDTDGLVPLDDPDTAAATTATAGTPGTFNGVRPQTLALLIASAIAGSGGVSAWSSGQYVILGNGTYAHWAGSGASPKWVVGKAA